LERLERRHKEWLRDGGLLDRPWFMLASAPEPTVPTSLPSDLAHIHIKYAGHTARKLGLPPADLTFLLEKTRPDQVAALTFRRILRMTPSDGAVTRNALRQRLPGASSVEMPISKKERDAILRAVIGDAAVGKGTEQRPSNGISMLCYALLLKVPKIILSGFSLSKDGHSYAENVRVRRHKEEDSAALEVVVAHFPSVCTTETELHNATGMPLFRPGDV
jgi:hypothetical protein